MARKSRFPADTVERLRALGHEVTVIDRWSSMVGQAQTIVLEADGGLMAGAADPRADGAAVGW